METSPFLASLAANQNPWNPDLEKACLKYMGETLSRHESPNALLSAVKAGWGIQRAYNLVQRSQVIFGGRARPRVAIFDHTFHLIGGGQKYGCTMAHVLQESCTVTLLSHRPISRDRLEEWYGLDLSGCTIESIPVPFFERPEYSQIDPGIITVRRENPFHPISRASGTFDIFINNSMLEMVYPLANVSVLVCHFPERRPSSFFYVDRYHHLVYNSDYTAEWIRRRWHIEPTCHIYPPADMAPHGEGAAKEKVILSVARFEPGGSKQQERMFEAFSRLRERHPQEISGWKLVLAGGSTQPNDYLERIKTMLRQAAELPVELHVNVSAAELRRLYERASLFWHLCGLNQTDPSLVEHFGMTIVEAMQNGVVPIVFDGGGQREIVEQGVSGFRFATRRELMARTLELMADNSLLGRMGRAARDRSREFSREAFEARVRSFFSKVISDYATLP